MTQYFETHCPKCDAGIPLVRSFACGLIGHDAGGVDKYGFLEGDECPRRPFELQRKAQRIVHAADVLIADIEAQGPGFIPYDTPDGGGDRIARRDFVRALKSIRALNEAIYTRLDWGA